MTNFAPVLIPTLNRFTHFVRCVDSLAECINAEKTDLFIALDYPAKENHWVGYLKIRNHLEKIQGFKSVTIIKQDVNLGAEKNSKQTITTIFNKNDRLIISEDDNVFAPSFLNFVNKGLDAYRDRKDIFSVSGYNSPFPMPIWYKNDAYLRTGFAGWGVGIWRDKWKEVDWSLETYSAMLSKKENLQILKKHYQTYLPQLLRIKDTSILTGDGLLFLHLLQNKMYSIYPTKTRVRNTGHDGSGVNCGNGGTLYMNQTVYEGVEEPCLPHDLKLDKRLEKYILKQIQPTFIEKVTMKIPVKIRVVLKKYLRK